MRYAWPSVASKLRASRVIDPEQNLELHLGFYRAHHPYLEQGDKSSPPSK